MNDKEKVKYLEKWLKQTQEWKQATENENISLMDENAKLLKRLKELEGFDRKS